jgi:thymidine kinase
MFAQKTTELLRRIRRYKSIGYEVLVVNYAKDTRYGSNTIASHDVDTYHATCVDHLAEIDAELRKGAYKVLVVDEGQFFDDLYTCITTWADELDIHIVVAGLDGDSERKPFGDILRLVPHAEEVERLTAFCAVCRDGTAATYSRCFVAKDGQVAVGAGDMYKPVCRKHYLEK